MVEVGRTAGRIARQVVLVACGAVVCAASVVDGQEARASVGSPIETLMAEGESIFGAECITCHAADGGADVGPALGGSTSLGVGDLVVKRLLEGVKDMPAFASSLSDRQVAAVATFVRNSWDNAHGPVLEADVKRVRDQLPKKTSTP